MLGPWISQGVLRRPVDAATSTETQSVVLPVVFVTRCQWREKNVSRALGTRTKTFKTHRHSVSILITWEPFPLLVTFTGANITLNNPFT